MDNRFTDRFRKAMELADKHARQLGHEYIGTEHILLGLIEENTGVAVNVLKNLGIDLHKVSREIRLIVPHLPKISKTDRLPQTPRAKKAIEYAIEESRTLNHNYVGTEHLLLGLLREGDGVAAQVLMNLGLKLDDGRKEVLNLLGFALPDVVTGSEEGIETRKVPDEVINNCVAESHRWLKDMVECGQIDLLIRQAIQRCWHLMPDHRLSVAEVEAQVRLWVEQAFRDFREDFRAFGPAESKPQ